MCVISGEGHISFELIPVVQRAFSFYLQENTCALIVLLCEYSKSDFVLLIDALELACSIIDNF